MNIQNMKTLDFKVFQNPFISSHKIALFKSLWSVIFGNDSILRIFNQTMNLTLLSESNSYNS